MAVRKMNCIAYCNLIKLLMEGTRTCAELAEDSGLHWRTVHEYTREMHRQGLLHIVAWAPDTRGRYIVRVFMWGMGKDVPRTKIPAVERSRAYRIKKKQIALNSIFKEAA